MKKHPDQLDLVPLAWNYFFQIHIRLHQTMIIWGELCTASYMGLIDAKLSNAFRTIEWQTFTSYITGVTLSLYRFHVYNVQASASEDVSHLRSYSVQRLVV